MWNTKNQNDHIHPNNTSSFVKQNKKAHQKVIFIFFLVASDVLIYLELSG